MFRQCLPIALGIMLTGCSTSKPNYSGSYVGGDDSVLIQLQIVESNDGRIDGSVAVSQFDYEAGKLKQTTKAVSGVRRDGQFSLLAHHKEWGASDAAFAMEAKGNSLFLKLPTNGQELELAKMNQEQYRERLTNFANAFTANDVGLVPQD